MAAHTRAIDFARAPDGTHLAYSISGSGPPMVTVAGLLTHLELDDEHPVIAPALALLRSVSTCLRYDERGSGLSDREVRDFSLATRVRDLAAVVDAAGLDRFGLFAASDGGPVAIGYAALHPERVSHLILAATFASGPHGYGPEAGHLLPAVTRLIRDGWGQDAVARRMLSVGMLPSLDEQSLDWLDEHQALIAGASHVAQAHAAAFRADASSLLARIMVPTLVLHAVDDPLVTFSEARRVAAAIPAARLQALDSGGHALPRHESVLQVCGVAIGDFLSTPWEPRAAVEDAAAGAFVTPALSPREAEVLDLVTRGLSNCAIAEELVLSTRTVERHLSNIYRKLGVRGTTARVSAVTSRLRDGGPIAPSPWPDPMAPSLTLRGG